MKVVISTALIAMLLMALGALSTSRHESVAANSWPEFTFHHLPEKRLCIVVHRVGTYPIAAYKCDENMVAE